MEAYTFNVSSEPTQTGQYFDDATDIDKTTFLDVLINGDTSDLLDCYFDHCTVPILLDVRSQTEFRDCSELPQLMPITEARIINIPSDQLLHMNKKSLEMNFGIKEEDTIICFCVEGTRSAQTTKKMNALGFDCFNLFGGMKSLGKKAIRKLARI